MPLVRTNVTLPEELLKKVDELAGPRRRSAYIAEAVERRVKRDWLGKVIEETAGAMVGRPGWRTSEETIAWVNELRSNDRDPWAEVERRELPAGHDPAARPRPRSGGRKRDAEGVVREAG